MNFIYSNTPDELEGKLAEELSALADKRVLWLVPGGSNIATACEVAKRLDDTGTDHLTAALTDERYGPQGHADSNFWQLQQAGFDTGKYNMIDVLKDNRPIEETVKFANELMVQLFAKAEVIVGLFGMGADGHIAGILPRSPAATDDRNMYAGYEANYRRMTLTPFAIRQLDIAYAGVFGEEKVEALTNLRDKSLPITEQPAQLLKELPRAIVYNNQIQ